MIKHPRKLLLCVITGIMLFCMIPIMVSAENYGGECGVSGDNITWSLDTETGILKIDGIGDMADYNMNGDNCAPWLLDGMNDYIKRIELSDGITSIGNNSFVSCDKLTCVELPAGLKRIGESAFRYCLDLIDITIPDSLIFIGKSALRGCQSLESIVIPDGVESLFDTFTGCQLLKDIVIPDSVMYIEEAFRGCKSLKGISLPKNLKSVGYRTFAYCTELKSIDIPNTVDCVGNDAFNGCKKLEKVIIPDSVESIGENAFDYCYALKEVQIPSSVKIIGKFAFSNCTSMAEINIENGVKEIGAYAFSGCSTLKRFEIPGSVRKLGANVVSGCNSMEQIIISDGLESIDGYDLSNNKAVDISIPKSVKYIQKSAFSMLDKLKNIYYAGSEVDWKRIDNIESVYEDGNLAGVTIHYGEIHEHNYEAVNSATCTKDGSISYICICGDAYSIESPAKGHKDANKDGICDNCNETMVECACICHKTGIIKIIWKMLRVFYKLFGINAKCTCGVMHY